MKNKFQSGEARVSLAREIAQEAMVLLKNEDNMLPLAPGTTVALIGRTQLDTVIGGGGSGASFSAETLQISEELQKAGLTLEPGMSDFYRALKERLAADAAKQDHGPHDLSALEGLVASGLIYEMFGKYVPAVPEELPEAQVWEAAGKVTDTAVVVIGRQTGGEECDRRVEDDYTLTPSEQEMLRLSCKHFSRVAVIFNVNGMVDLAAVEAYPQVKAVLFMGTCGEQSAGALADILTGKVSPSGKLSQTAALRYEDYPTAAHFSSNKDAPESILTYEDYDLDAAANGSVGFDRSPVTVYAEDIYVGYRYFDSFEKPVLYPFGFGLSYAVFAIETVETAVEDGNFRAGVKVSNTSKQYAGKEAVQLYVHAPFGALKKPWQELKAIAKTPLLQPGESCEVELTFKLEELASFDQDAKQYVIEVGQYTVLIGNSSRYPQPAATLAVPETIITREVSADIDMLPVNREKIKLLEPEQELPVRGGDDIPHFTVTADALSICWPAYSGYDFSVEPIPSTIQDVKDGKVTMEQFVGQMSLRELAVLCNGYGPGLPFGGLGHKEIPVTIQDEDGKDIGTKTRDDVMPGYCNPAIEKYGILTTSYKDGPASVGKTAWPTGMMIACTFNPVLAYEFGSACGCEAEQLGIDSWLAPGMNLIRNPIEGRAFEYFSEDPYLCGLFGTQIAKGAMENNQVTVCPKHFALNEQETYRRGSEKKNIDAVDSIASARAVRELYLKPFEMCLTQAEPRMLMTSFNKVNGIFAAGNKALCTEILRGEWSFDGVVVTDWGDLDIVVDGADAVHAGNDVIMPGGPPVIAQVLKGCEEGRVSLDEMREAVVHLMNYLIGTKEEQKC